MQTKEQSLLKDITDLSHQFGASDYVCGGGGNTSVKNQTTLWVKPSGTTLAGLQPESFVALDRQKMSQLYAIRPPQSASEREALVKEKMAAALLAGQTGRPSVEAALHDSLSARFVVHTHPALVNGMTCAKDGKAVCGRLFPDALWMDYVDPGYTLCIAVRRQIDRYRAENGHEPSVIFLKNHGVFAAGDSPQEIREIYAMIFDRLSAEYKKAKVSVNLHVPSLPKRFDLEAQCKKIRAAFGEDKLCVAASGAFAVAKGPLSPDHIVYARSYPLIGEPTPEAVAEYKGRYGYTPQIVVCGSGVFGIGSSEKKAALALELARNGALVVQLAGAFGGVDYMTEAARRFIEGWEVESYRSSQIQ
jgi:rhamnose utilization protein RhaD (predicted bifunctional aldolase and dehydrogenase)